MISVEEARARVLATLHPTGPETVSLAAAFGRVLAAPLKARLTQPPADLSAMDGYALRAEDGFHGAQLTLIGTAPAGHPFPGTVGPGQTVRLFTGSVVPEGADAVLIQEDAALDGAMLTVAEAVRPGRHIRRAGQDFAAGDTLLDASRRLTARDVGLAAAGNHPWVAVHRRPRIAILATGDEISLPGEAVSAGGVISSNAHALAAFIAASGAEPTILPIAGDNLDALARGAVAAQGADLLVTTGGASVGDHDLVRQTEGMVLDFWKIAMRPGKPLIFGRVGALPVLGLPGNPVSAFVCALLFLRPALDRLSGLRACGPALEPGILGIPLKANDHREDYLRATLSAERVATPFPVQDSGMLRNLAHADCLIRRPANQAALPAGAAVEIIRLQDL